MIDRWIGAVRWLWNTSLDIRSSAYREYKLSLTGVDLSRWLTQWKQTPGYTWLAEQLPRVARPNMVTLSRDAVGRYDRDVNAARSILHEGMKETAGRDGRDLRVLADEARSRRRARAPITGARKRQHCSQGV